MPMRKEAQALLKLGVILEVMEEDSLGEKGEAENGIEVANT